MKDERLERALVNLCHRLVEEAERGLEIASHPPQYLHGFIDGARTAMKYAMEEVEAHEDDDERVTRPSLHLVKEPDDGA